MAAFLLRAPRRKDTEDILDCWLPAFHDGPETVQALLAEGGLLENAMAAEAEGRVRAVMFAFDGLSFTGMRTSYLYALCTHPAYRGLGMGGAVAKALLLRCLAGGAALVCLQPADCGLSSWYQALLGMRPLCFSAALPFVPGSAERGSCRVISAGEYHRLRQAEPEVPLRLLRAQEILFSVSGGAFCRLELGDSTGLACVEPRDGGLLLRELLCPPAAEPAALAVLSAHFGGAQLLRAASAAVGLPLLGRTRDTSQPLPSCRLPFPLD